MSEKKDKRIGNEFWKMRSKHGRDKIIKSAIALAASADEYFKWCQDNPVYEIDYRVVSGKLIEVELPHPKSFQKNELARFCHCAKWETVNDMKTSGKDYLEVITRIEGIIADQKYQYAVVGMFNATIVSRDLGLVDKKELEQKIVDEFSSKSDSELRDLAGE